ncbi:MAG: glycosyltransferase family 47 protein [Patescibacteria group bacterium]|nr:glycosyltransferase family 47 protein [Patescibacteria group bacterium]
MAGQIIKIFSEKIFLASVQKHEIIMYPFWGDNGEDLREPTTGRFEEYVNRTKEIFKLVSLKECDFAVLPGQWNAQSSEARDFLFQAEQAGKPTVVFFNSDSTEDIPVKNGFIFRTSFYQSSKKSNEYAMPGWSEDFVERYYGNQLPLRQKSEKPVVSYCGYGRNWKYYLKEILGRPIHPGERIRGQAMALLRKCAKVETNFKLRRGYWADAFIYNNPAHMMQVRKEFVENLAAGDYALCARGGGNFSYRLYEALSLGRIPVFINTDCVLPYEQFIDWKKICVWVEESEIGKIGEKIIAYHNRLSPEDFAKRQQEIRKIWEEWISPYGFFKNLHKIILQKK